ncbi:beta-galactosidase [Verrucomicrobiota bacterium sgz303538]
MNLLHAPAFLAGAFLFACSAFGADETELRPWDEYRTIMWTSDSLWKKPEKSPVVFDRLREMGINTAMVHNEADPKLIHATGWPYYVENIVNRGLCLKWNSPVRDWGKVVTEWGKKRDEAGLIRPYSLNDPQWRADAKAAIKRVLKTNAQHPPVAYNLRDELSTTVSANPFDYDFSPVALDGFRAWLKTRYPDLSALNNTWETEFKSWEEVKPFTTDQIKNRMSSGEARPRGNPDWQALRELKFDPAIAQKQPTRWNFAPWADHRTFMDISLADALGDLRRAIREIDPRTPVGIEGTQMPAAFGGYDLSRLSQVLDWVEPYDIGNSRDIFGSFMPGKPMLCTVGEQDAKAAQRRLWHLLLMGDKGCIVWWSDDCIDTNTEDYSLTPRAKALAPVLKEMTSPLARLFLRAKRESDPIAIHYSQPSIQVNWLLESQVDGSSWLRRFSSYEASHNRMLKVRNAWLKLVTDLGYSPRFVSSEQVEKGELVRGGYRALIMPESLAVSDAEANAVKTWLFADKQPRVFLSNGIPGLFDDHARLRPQPAFADLIPYAGPTERVFVRNNNVPLGNPAVDAREGNLSDYNAERSRVIDSTWEGDANRNPDLWSTWARAKAFDAIAASIQVPPASRVAVHRFRLGEAQLVAFERNISYQMSEDLKQVGGNEPFEKPISFESKLPAPAHIYDLRTQKYLGHSDRISVSLDPWHPSIFALLSEQVPEDRVLDLLNR